MLIYMLYSAARKYFRCLSICLLATAISSAVATATDWNTTEVLDRIDSERFVSMVTGPASDFIGVEFQILATTPEGKFLVEHAGEAIPEMLQRLRISGGIHYQPTRLVYYMVFRQTKDPRVLPALADYLDSSAPTSAEPFPYALWAACSFVDCYKNIRNNGESNANSLARHEIAKQLRLLAAKSSVK